MRVDLAAQVLSESVSKALRLTGGAEAEETAQLLSNMDKFFDCLNVNNFTSGTRQRKPFQFPYHSGDDFRLKVRTCTCIIIVCGNVFYVLCIVP